MNKTKIRKWAKALRSGNYQQAFGHLKDGEKLCVLGVGCELFRLSNPDKAKWRGDSLLMTTTDEHRKSSYEWFTSMPPDVVQWYGLDEHELTIVNELMSDNDKLHSPFDELADELELFVESWDANHD